LLLCVRGVDVPNRSSKKYTFLSAHTQLRVCLDPLCFYKNWFLKKLGGGVWRQVSKS
jgi:hypothetical protein